MSWYKAWRKQLVPAVRWSLKWSTIRWELGDVPRQSWWSLSRFRVPRKCSNQKTTWRKSWTTSVSVKRKSPHRNAWSMLSMLRCFKWFHQSDVFKKPMEDFLDIQSTCSWFTGTFHKLCGCRKSFWILLQARLVPKTHQEDHVADKSNSYCDLGLL